MLIPTQDWPRSTPEAQGIPSGAIERFARAAEENGHNMHSLLVLRHGQLVYEGYWAPYHARQPHNLYSASKSFTSTLIGIAQDEGLLSVRQRIWEFFPEYAVPDGYAGRITLQDLLTMTVGHGEEPTMAMQAGEDWIKTFLSWPVPYEPGTHFLYNTGATYMLSAVLTRVTGCTALDYGTPRLFEPLGIRPRLWQTCPQGINTGGFGLVVTPREMARLGYLYLHKGLWGKRRILSEAWVADATSRHSAGNPGPNNWNAGYGYQFWRNDFADSYRADGYGGQFIVILPHQDMVVVMTQGVDDMNDPLEKLRHILLPTLSVAALPEDAAAYESLTRFAAGRQTPAAQPVPPLPQLARDISGKTYRLEDNAVGLSTLRFHFGEPTEAVLEWNERQGGAVWRLGLDGLFRLSPNPDAVADPLMAGRGEWRGDVFHLTLMPMGEPKVRELSVRFRGTEIELRFDHDLRSPFDPALPSLLRGWNALTDEAKTATTSG